MGTVPAVRPEWFVSLTGSVQIRYAPLGALLLALGLIFRVRYAWYFAVGVLALLLLTLGILPLLGGGPILLLLGGPAMVAVKAMGIAVLAVLTFIPYCARLLPRPDLPPRCRGQGSNHGFP